MPKILLLEDDHDIARSLKICFTELDPSLDLCWMKAPSEAEKDLKETVYDLIILDMMLPEKSGIDFYREHLAHFKETPCFFISGIFKADSIKQEALSFPNVKDYVYKPFELNDFAQKVLGEIKVKTQAINDEAGFVASFDINNPAERLQGFYIPWLCLKLSYEKWSGQVSLRDQKGKEYRLFFNNGFLNQVETPDPRSYVGQLLLEEGFINEQDLEIGLKNRSGKSIGQSLIDQALVSPHSVPHVLMEQVRVRLSRMSHSEIFDARYDKEVLSSDPESGLNLMELKAFYKEWVKASLSHKWLLSEFKNFLEQDYEEDDLQKKALIDSYLETAVSRNIRKESLNKLNLESLKKYLSFIQSSTPFAVLKVKEDDTDGFIKKQYQALMKNYHVDRHQDLSPESLKVLEQILGVLGEKYQFIKSQDLRKSYQKGVQARKVQRIINAEEQLRQAAHYLERLRYTDALEILSQLKMQKELPEYFEIYHLWALVKTKKPIEILDQKFEKIKIEHQHNYLFFFVKALYKKAKGDLPEAQAAFKKSYQKNEKFLPLIREINIDKNQQQKAVAEDESFWNKLWKKSA